MTERAAAPGVLVVVATLGQRPATLPQALASIRQQEGVRTRIVVVAPEGHADVERAAAEAGAELVVDPRRGLSAAVNAGIAARTDEEFFAWVGDDDLLIAGGLATLADLLNRNRDAVVAYGACGYIDDDSRLIGMSRAGRWATSILAWGPDLVPQAASLYRLEAIERAGVFDEELKYAMDLDMFLRLRRLGRFVCTAQETARFRWHADSLTVANRNDSLDESERVKRRYLSSRVKPFAPAWELPVRYATHVAAATVNRRARKIGA